MAQLGCAWVVAGAMAGCADTEASADPGTGGDGPTVTDTGGTATNGGAETVGQAGASAGGQGGTSNTGERIWSDTSTELIVTSYTHISWPNAGTRSSCLRYPREGMTDELLAALASARLVEKTFSAMLDMCTSESIYITDADGTRAQYPVYDECAYPDRTVLAADASLLEALSGSEYVSCQTCGSDPGCDYGTCVAGMCEGGGFCGDGQLNGRVEECDDGNTTAGDGCNASCLLEPD